MKHIYLILFLLLCNLSSAQDLRLFDNYWYLTNVIKNGTSNVPPRTNMGVVFDSPTSMVARACYFLYGEVTFENNTTGFSGTHFSPCLCWCTDPIADAYEGVYFSFFTPDHNYQAVENFTYTITEQGDEKTLIINSTLNEQAIYSKYSFVE